MNAQDGFARLDRAVSHLFPVGIIAAIVTEAIRRFGVGETVKPAIHIAGVPVSLWLITALASWFLAVLVLFLSTHVGIPGRRRLATDSAYREKVGSRYAPEGAVASALASLTATDAWLRGNPEDSVHRPKKLADKDEALETAVRAAGDEAIERRFTATLVGIFLLGAAVVLSLVLQAFAIPGTVS